MIGEILDGGENMRTLARQKPEHTWSDQSTGTACTNRSSFFVAHRTAVVWQYDIIICISSTVSYFRTDMMMDKEVTTIAPRGVQEPPSLPGQAGLLPHK